MANSGQITAGLKSLVTAVAEQVVGRIQMGLPGREEFRALRKQIRSLERKIGRGRTGRGPGRPPSNRLCQIKGCGLPHTAHGFCSKHYQAWRRGKLKHAGAPVGPKKSARKSGRKPGRGRKHSAAA